MQWTLHCNYWCNEDRPFSSQSVKLWDYLPKPQNIDSNRSTTICVALIKKTSLLTASSDARKSSAQSYQNFASKCRNKDLIGLIICFHILRSNNISKIKLESEPRKQSSLTKVRFTFFFRFCQIFKAFGHGGLLMTVQYSCVNSCPASPESASRRHIFDLGSSVFYKNVSRLFWQNRQRKPKKTW